MKKVKNQAIVITISVVIFISFLSLIYKSGNFDDNKKEEAPMDIASGINDKVEARKDDILKQKTEELANRIEELLKVQGGEMQEVVVEESVQQAQPVQPAQIVQPAPKPAPVVQQPAPKPAPQPVYEPIPEPTTSVS